MEKQKHTSYIHNTKSRGNVFRQRRNTPLNRLKRMQKEYTGMEFEIVYIYRHKCFMASNTEVGLENIKAEYVLPDSKEQPLFRGWGI